MRQDRPKGDDGDEGQQAEADEYASDGGPGGFREDQFDIARTPRLILIPRP